MKKFSLFLIMTFLTVMMGFLPEETRPLSETKNHHWMEP